MAEEEYEFDLVCIGSGPAGQRGAVQAAKLGNRVAVIERKRTVGGVCIDTGTIPSKTFREAVIATANSHRGARHGSLSGTPTRPSAEQLFERVSSVVQREESIVEQQLRRNDIVMIRGEAAFKDAHTIAVSSEEGRRDITADKVLIACGTRPVPPVGVDTLSDVVITSDDVCSLKHLSRTLAVVGAGVIGIEYASMFAKIGVEVTLIDRRSRPLEFLDHEIVDELIHQMRNCNVTFRFEEVVDHIEVAPGPRAHAVIHLESGKRIIADMALFSVGRVGATDTLQLEAAGLCADERGRLKVNASYQTDVQNIFAAGDVIGYPSLAATSSEQGRLAVCHAFGREARPMAAHFPIGIYSIPEISMVGTPEHELTTQRVPYEVGIARYREIARGQILDDDSGLFKMLFHRDTRQLLGVHAIGTGATELIHIGQAVIGTGGGLDYFLETVFNYPTLAECYKVAALDAANKLAR